MNLLPIIYGAILDLILEYFFKVNEIKAIKD